ncbi:MAG: Ig-like domain-containing protein [Thermoplasmatota archaeon]
MQREAARILKRIWSFFFPDRQTLQVFLLSMFVLLTIFSAGVYLNDESEQVTSLYNLLNGDLTIEEVPDQYYVSRAGIHVAPRFTEYGGHRYIAASHGMSVFSVPFYYGLAAADFVMGVEAFFPLLWSLALGAFLYLSSGCIAGWAQKKWPNVNDMKQKIRWLSIGAPAGLFAVNMWLLQPLSFELWGPPIAMQFMSLVFVSLGLAVLFRFFRFVFDSKTAFFGSFLLLVASPVAFWAIGQKYHGLNFALLVFAFASFIYGKKTGKQRYHYGGYVFAALAVWIQLYSGVVILLSLLLVDVLTTKRRRILNLVTIVFVVSLSLTPYLVENYVIYDNPLYPGYIAKGNRNVIPPDPPTVTMISPASGAYVTGTTLVAYNVSDNAERSVIRFSSDGENWTTLHTSTNTSVSFDWNTTNATEGIGILNVAARNWRGDRATRNVSVVVDNTPPIVSFLSPAEDSVVAGNVTVRCNLSADVAVVDYWYSDGDGWTWLGNDTTPHDGFAWNTTGLQGSYSLKVVATDHVGYQNSSIVSFTVDNSGEHLILMQPSTGSYIGNTATVDSIAPPGATHIKYEYLLNDTWQLLGVDYTPETPFTWNTTSWLHTMTALRATAHHDGQVMETMTTRGITIDNRMPTISITEPAAGAEIRDVAVVSYNTSDNTAYVEVQYSPDNRTWQTAGVDYSSSRFALDVSNLTGNIWLKTIAVSRTRLNATAHTSFRVVRETEMGALGRLSFIVNSLEVGWEFLKRVSAVGEPEKVPLNLYKSFFNARGTEASFAFFVFVPLFILSLFSPLVYLWKKKSFSMLDGLMLTYIILHLFIFVNVSVTQGGGYDMRWYLPLHLPFLYFATVFIIGYVPSRIRSIEKTYWYSMLVLLPVFIWVLYITSLNQRYFFGNINHFIEVSRLFGIILVATLTATVLLERLRRWGGLQCNIGSLLPPLAGVGVFSGTLAVLITNILISRGLPASYIPGNDKFTMFIPVVRLLQDVLHQLLIG